jgi:hypothetical protein
MNLFSIFGPSRDDEVRKHVRDDVEGGVYDPEAFIESHREAPPLSATEQQRHRNTATKTSEIDELEEDLRSRNRTNPLVMFAAPLRAVALVIFFFMEWVTLARVFLARGASPEDAYTTSFVAASTLVGLIRGATSARSRFVQALCYIALVVIFLSIGYVRASSFSDDGTPIDLTVSGVIALAAAVGAGVALHYLNGQLGETAADSRRFRAAARELRARRRELATSQNAVESGEREASRLAAEEKRLRAEYVRLHRIESTRAGLGPHHDNGNSIPGDGHDTPPPAAMPLEQHTGGNTMSRETAKGLTRKIQAAGGGRGAQQGLPRWAEAAKRSSLGLEVEVIDPAPGKALDRVLQAEELGITATARELRFQDAMVEDGFSDVVMLVAVDDPASIAEGLLLAAEYERTVVLNVFIQLPSGKLVGMRGAFGKKNRDEKIAAAAFFTTLDRVTVHAGSSAVWGAAAPPANILLQPPMRDWFAEGLERVFRMTTGVRPEGATIEITFDGVGTLPLAVRDSRGGWADKATLAREIAEQKPFALPKGSRFAIVEVGNDEIQFVTGRLRALDRTISVDTIEPVSAAAYEEAMRRAEQARLSATNPVNVTD